MSMRVDSRPRLGIGCLGRDPLAYIPTNQEQLKVVTHKNASAFLRDSLNDWDPFKPLPLGLFSSSLPIRPRFQRNLE